MHRDRKHRIVQQHNDFGMSVVQGPGVGRCTLAVALFHVEQRTESSMTWDFPMMASRKMLEQVSIR